MGYKIYTKSETGDEAYYEKPRFEQWDGKTYATKAAATRALKKYQAKYGKNPNMGKRAGKKFKTTWEIRSDGKTMKKKPARRGGFTGSGFSSGFRGGALETRKFRGFM